MKGKFTSPINRKKGLYLGIMVLLFSAFIHRQHLFEVTKNLEIFTAVYKEIHLNYVEDLNPGEMMKTGIDAMLTSLDPYTNFYTESQVEDALIKRQGEFGTPGIEVMQLGTNLVVSRVASGSSAEVLGVQLGDIIKRVNGRDFSEKSEREAYEAFEGSAGSVVSITFERNKESFTHQLTRSKLDLRNVSYYGLINEKTGYIKLDQFMQNSAEEVKNAFIELKKQKIQQLVLDLRNNGGGLLIDAVRILNIFIPREQLVVVTRGKTQAQYSEYRTFEPSIDTSIPLIVLINENAASASEIVAGVVQDLDRGLVLGANSFGKGLVQNQVNLPYRHSMKVTIAKYYIPSGRCIQVVDYAKNKRQSDTNQTIFFTKNKRKVYEGKGIAPDIFMSKEANNAFVNALKNKQLIFEFVTNYPGTLKLQEGADFPANLYEEFSHYVHQKDFTYESASEQQLEKLLKEMEKEDYGTTDKKALVHMTEVIQQQKSKDFERHKPLILPMLEIELARKFLGEKDQYTVIFKHDIVIHKALELFSQPQTFAKLLTP